MITLGKDCLVFMLGNGEMIPFSAEMISVELTGDSARLFEPEVASNAAKAVFYYFKSELERQYVTAEEFAEAMQKVLHGLKLGDGTKLDAAEEPAVLESDLSQLAQEAGEGCELLFFPRLRNELRQHLRQSPRMLHFRGLRACVKHIAGARRWTPRCRELEEQIVGFIRQCAGAETGSSGFAMRVE
jgi:hypothetical protein